MTNSTYSIIKQINCSFLLTAKFVRKLVKPIKTTCGKDQFLHNVCLLNQVLFACAEALHAHGYSNEACRLAAELARDLLANPPDLKVEQPQTKVYLILSHILLIYIYIYFQA